MNRRYRRKKRTPKIKTAILTHIENNIKEYLIVTIIFIIGLIVGVIFINNINETQYLEITTYINSFIDGIKEDKNIDNFELLKDSVKKNVVLAVLLWFMGSTVIGMFIVYSIVCFRGFCLGYTISSIILCLGTGKGIVFLLSTMLLQNILFIPCILAISVSGMKLHNSIMKDKGRENIKVEILRHTLFSIVVVMILIIASLIEVYASKNILLFFVKYL